MGRTDFSDQFRKITRNWLKARLIVYPQQCADRNPVNFSKLIFQH